MITFGEHVNTFLIEGKNTHMEHIEDSLFNDGASGAVDAVRFLKSVTEMLSGNSKRSGMVPLLFLQEKIQKTVNFLLQQSRCSTRHQK
jgi:hypothetical protein